MFPFDAGNETKVTLETGGTPIPEEQPFHILLIGDWSGRKSRGAASAPSFRPLEIDRDNFDDVIKKLQVGLNLDFQGEGNNVLTLNFAELEDFHPDRIFEKLAVFDNLRDIRRRLVNKDTFNVAAQEVRSWLNDYDESDNTKPADSLPANQSSTENLLDQILLGTNESASDSSTQTVASSELRRFVKDIVQPHLIQTDSAEQSKLLMIVDEVISDLMRKILHHPDFQALESAWRGAFFLVRRTETAADLKIFLLDISKEELISDLKSAEDLTDTEFYRIYSQEGGNNSWTVCCGNFTFSLNVDEIASLIRLAKISANANVPFISHVNSEILGFNSFDEAVDRDNWQVSDDSADARLWFALRSLPESSHLGLALPRFLIRLPYGESAEPTETFSFEEFTGTIKHSDFLWANPSFACALLLAQTFRHSGWNISENLLQDISNLPLYHYQLDNETIAKACDEVTISENKYQQILDKGLIPLISYKNMDKIRLGRLQSVSIAMSALKGNWN